MFQSRTGKWYNSPLTWLSLKEVEELKERENRVISLYLQGYDPPTKRLGKGLYNKLKDMNKYFTPKIEDLRIGYECEFWADPSKEENGWQKFIFKNIFESSNLSSIRTPYLTQAQIKEEGWTFKELRQGKLDSTYFIYTKYRSDSEEAKKAGGWLMDGFTYNWTLYVVDLSPFYGETKLGDIIIEQNKRGGIGGTNETHASYWGKCPSINELRYICKLINIK